MTEVVDGSPKWTQLEPLERRVLGVLVEKAKTTPDAYPLTLKGLVTGSNQKSNRYPQMDVDEDRVEEAIDRLRTVGAVSIIQGDGRVEKYRHLAYDWLGVDKMELAVMAELLLRGAQTLGELRGRAARMEPIKGMAELGPLLESLQAKSLVIYLTPPGRGAVVTHNLYQPREMDKLRREHGIAMPAHPHPDPGIAASAIAKQVASAPASMPTVTTSSAVSQESVAAQTSSDIDPQVELVGLREEVAHLRTSLAVIKDETEESIADIRRQLEDLNRQLGN